MSSSSASTFRTADGWMRSQNSNAAPRKHVSRHIQLKFVPRGPCGLKAGIDGFVHSKSTWHEFQDAIARMATGQKYFLPAFYERGLDRCGGRPCRSSSRHFDPKGKEVLALIGTGYTSKQIASRLTLSASTVDTHRRNLMTKMGHITCQADLVLFAIGEGLIVPSRRNN